MAKVALYSPSVLSSASAGSRLPTLEVTLAFVAACGGDRAEWRRRWLALTGRAGETAGDAGRAARRPQPDGDSQPAPATAPRPAQLPVEPYFVGREAELAAGRAMVGSAAPPRRPLLITGPVGVGKTAFALRLAGELVDELPDGQLYADLGDGTGEASPFDVVTGFLGALGVVAAQIPADLTERIALYRSLLADRRLLVLLDDAVDERQVRPLLAQTPHSQIMVTSRSRLLGLDGASRVQLDLLARDESVAMIGAIAGARLAQAGTGLVDRLVELCAGLPLALDIVARKIAARPEWPVAYTAGQLVESSRLLDRLQAGDLSVRGRLASTYRRQRPLARAVLRQLGTSGAAHVTATTVAATWTLTIEAAEDQLEALLDAGLLRRASAAGHYQLPPLFGLFAAEQSASTAFGTDESPALDGQDGAKHAANRRAESWLLVNCSARSTLPANAAPGFNEPRWMSGNSCASRPAGTIH